VQETIQTHFEHYLQEQSPENFMRLREAVAASPGYASYSGNYKDGAYPLLEAEKFEEAI
jgi:hypothetical protein